MTKKIDLMTRDSLINIAIKLQIDGYKNFFNKPYIKKDSLKNIIVRELNLLKKKKAKSLNVSKKPKLSGGSKAKMKMKTQSLCTPSIKKRSFKKNISSVNDIIQIYDINRCAYPKVKKLVAIGDIHGDLSVAIKALKLAGVIDKSTDNNIRNINDIKCTGGDTYVVQLGDQIDRVRPSNLHNNLCSEKDEDLCDDEGSDLKIICLFENLHKQAKKNGGALFSIFGNHELMNVDGDFRYVSPREFKEFGNYFKATFDEKSEFPFGYNERINAFKPGGILAKRLAMTRYSVLQVGSWLFVHGSISPECAETYSLTDINKHIKEWLMGTMKDNSHLNKLYHSEDEDNSPFWSRIYGDMDEWDEEQSSQSFNKTINNLNIKNLRKNTNIIKGMILGHSPQFMYNKGINSSCNNKIWRVDVGASKAFGKVDNDNESKLRKVQVLVIENDGDDNRFHILDESSLD